VRAERDSIVGSCNCGVKTNDPQCHAPGCKYRLISERDDYKEKWLAACDALIAAGNERDAALAALRLCRTALTPFGTYHTPPLQGAIGRGTELRIMFTAGCYIDAAAAIAAADALLPKEGE